MHISRCMHFIWQFDTWTPKYLDDKHANDAGCDNRWRIKTPDIAPMWMKNMKLCFKWEGLIERRGFDRKKNSYHYGPGPKKNSTSEGVSEQASEQVSGASEIPNK